MSWKTSRFPKNQESVLRSSFFQDQAPTALWINNHPPSSPSLNGPLKKAFIVHHCSSRSSPKALEDPFKPKSSRRSVRHCSSSSSPKALEDPFVTVLRVQAQALTALEESVHRSSLFFEIKPKSPRRSVQAQKLSKIRSSLFFEFKPKSPRKSVHHCSSRSSPKALEDPSITILQDQAQKPLKIRSSSFIQDQASTALGSIAHPTNQHLTEIESEDQNRERL
ncbi:hypothetical protein ACFX19_021847 [Malus domestica]